LREEGVEMKALFALLLLVSFTILGATSVRASSAVSDVISLNPSNVGSPGSSSSFTQDVNIAYAASSTGAYPTVLATQYVLTYDRTIIDVDTGFCQTVGGTNYCGVIPDAYALLFTTTPLLINISPVPGTSNNRLFVSSIASLSLAVGVTAAGGVHSTIHWKVTDNPAVGGITAIGFSRSDTFYATTTTSVIDPNSIGVPYTPLDGLFDNHIGNPVHDIGLKVSLNSTRVIAGAGVRITSTLSDNSTFTTVPDSVAFSITNGIVIVDQKPLMISGGQTMILDSDYVTGPVTSTTTITFTAIATLLGDPTPVDNTAFAPLVVTPPTPDFSITADPSSLSLNVGSSGSFGVTTTSFGGFSGTVTLTPLVSPSTGIVLSCSPVDLTLTATATASCVFDSSTVGLYSVTVTGASGQIVHSVNIAIDVLPDFSLSVSPAVPFSLAPRETAVSNVTLYSLGFSGDLSVTATVSPAVLNGPMANLANERASLQNGQLLSLSLIISTSVDTPGRDYAVTVTATNGTLTHTAFVTFRVLGFAIFAPDIMAPFNAGSSGTTIITINNPWGPSDVVGLVAISSKDFIAALSPDSITGSGNSTLTVVAGYPGTYTVIVTGTLGSISHSTNVTVRVSGFLLASDPTSFSIEARSSGTSTITFTRIYDFNGTVRLSVLPPSGSGLFVSVNPATIQLGPGKSVSATLTVLVPSNVARQEYPVTINATAGLESHSLSVSVIVTPPPVSTNKILGLDPLVLYTIVGLGLAAGIISVGLVFHRRRNPGSENI
jgi:hypothetical protein